MSHQLIHPSKTSPIRPGHSNKELTVITAKSCIPGRPLFPLYPVTEISLPGLENDATRINTISLLNQSGLSPTRDFCAHLGFTPTQDFCAHLGIYSHPGLLCPPGNLLPPRTFVPTWEFTPTQDFCAHLGIYSHQDFFCHLGIFFHPGLLCPPGNLLPPRTFVPTWEFTPTQDFCAHLGIYSHPGLLVPTWEFTPTQDFCAHLGIYSHPGLLSTSKKDTGSFVRQSVPQASQTRKTPDPSVDQRKIRTGIILSRHPGLLQQQYSRPITLNRFYNNKIHLNPRDFTNT